MVKINIEEAWVEGVIPALVCYWGRDIGGSQLTCATQWDPMSKRRSNQTNKNKMSVFRWKDERVVWMCCHIVDLMFFFFYYWSVKINVLFLGLGKQLGSTELPKAGVRKVQSYPLSQAPQFYFWLLVTLCTAFSSQQFLDMQMSHSKSRTRKDSSLSPQMKVVF